MSEAPDRIWACVSKNTKSGVVTLLGDATFHVNGWQEYVRVDRIEELEAEKDWYRDHIVWGFYEDGEPKYYQGKAGEHEICDPVTAEEVNNLLRGWADTEAKLAKAVEALEKIEKHDHQGTAINALQHRLYNNPSAAKEVLEAIASTDIQSWANTALAELKGYKT